MLRQKCFWIALAAIILASLISCGSQPPAEKPLLPAEETVPLSEKDRILNEILQCLRKGDFDGALALFDQLSAEEVGQSDIVMLKSSVLLSAGRLPAAKTLINELITAEPENVEAYFVLSSIEAAARNDRGQRAALDNSLKLDPEHVKSLVSLGNIYLRNESWSHASSRFEKALKRKPDDAAALIGMSSALRKQKQPDQAMELMNRAVELHPDNPQVYSVRSRLFRDAGLLSAALSDLEAAEKLDGRDYWIAYDKGRTLLSMEKKPEALAAFEKANAVNPTEFVAYIFSAGIRTDAGDFDGAEKDYAALTRVNPDYYYGFEGLGMLKMKKKEYREARDAFTAAYTKASSETGYAILAALCALRGQSRFEVKPFLENAMKPLKRDSLDYTVLRLLNDYSGDSELSRKIQNEKDPYLKCRSAFYLAEYYDIINKHALAETFYEICKSTNRRDTIEWRLNEWIREQRSMLAQP